MIFCFTGNGATRLVNASLSALARADARQPARKHRILRGLSWKPACTHHLQVIDMWLVWCLEILVGICLLLSMVDIPFSRR
jgi:hypothetical protein